MKGYILNARKADLFLFEPWLQSDQQILMPGTSSEFCAVFLFSRSQRCLFCKHSGWFKALLVLIFIPELTEQNA